MLKILVLSAIPQEYAHLRKITPPWRLLRRLPFKTFSFTLPGKEITLIETGMGAVFAVNALLAELARSRPNLLILSGFGGGLHRGLATAQICAVKKTRIFDPAAQFGSEPIELHYSSQLSEFLLKRQIMPVSALTVLAPPAKSALAALMGDEISVVDMETASVAGIALKKSLPFICLRAISDGVYDELGFDLADIMGRAGKVDPFGALRTMIFKPAVVGAFYRSWRRSNLAGAKLGRVLADFLELPEETLKEIALGTKPAWDRG